MGHNGPKMTFFITQILVWTVTKKVVRVVEICDYKIPQCLVRFGRFQVQSIRLKGAHLSTDHPCPARLVQTKTKVIQSFPKVLSYLGEIIFRRDISVCRRRKPWTTFRGVYFIFRGVCFISRGVCSISRGVYSICRGAHFTGSCTWRQCFGTRSFGRFFRPSFRGLWFTLRSFTRILFTLFFMHFNSPLLICQACLNRVTVFFYAK